MWRRDHKLLPAATGFLSFTGRKGVDVPVRLGCYVVLVLSVTMVFYANVNIVEAKGSTEVEIQWKLNDVREKDSGLSLIHSLSWQGEPGHLSLPVELEISWRKAMGADFSLEKGQLILRPADCELRIFHDVGFRSTLDPMRLLSSSRRSEGASGLELNGSVGSVVARGLWLDEIDNIGDDGPLLLVDMSLDMKDRAGSYRYLYLSHDSDWQWHVPKTGAYATRTARQVHSLVGTWDLESAMRVSAQMAALTGLDQRKTYRRDLQGFAILSKGEGRFGSTNWWVDAYRTNPGFFLATGDADSPGAGRQGLRAGLASGRYRDRSFRIDIQHDRPIPELLQLQKEAPAHVAVVEPDSQVEMSYRRRTDSLSYRLGLGLAWEGNAMARNPKIVWEANWLSRNLQIGGRLGGSGSSQIYSRFPLHPLVSGDVRWDPVKGWWRTALRLDGLQSKHGEKSPWQGEAVYKKRAGEAYTYVAVQHKMKQGYWAVIWGKSDRGRLDWAWDETPQISIRLGRYF